MGIGLKSTTNLANGVSMPWLGPGVWQAKDGEEVERAVLSTIETGYRSIDTTAIYHNEGRCRLSRSADTIVRDTVA